MLSRVPTTFVLLLMLPACDPKDDAASAKSESGGPTAKGDATSKGDASQEPAPAAAAASADTGPAVAAPPGPAPTPTPPAAAPAAPPAAPPAGDAGKPAADGAVTPELEALHATLKPILAITDADARSAAACKAADALHGQMVAVGKNPPAGVDAYEWNAQAEVMSGGMNDLAIECAEDGFTNAGALVHAMAASKEFAGLLAKKAP
jgi:hypothetical protein